MPPKTQNTELNKVLVKFMRKIDRQRSIEEEKGKKKKRKRRRRSEGGEVPRATLAATPPGGSPASRRHPRCPSAVTARKTRGFFSPRAGRPSPLTGENSRRPATRPFGSQLLSAAVVE
ncbi:hypothetical protein GW17_00042036 [Ensete ventricosum]|nr:hypothetical protein GW17_00042036 [Ensete ventricosum]